MTTIKILLLRIDKERKYLKFFPDGQLTWYRFLFIKILRISSPLPSSSIKYFNITQVLELKKYFNIFLKVELNIVHLRF